MLRVITACVVAVGLAGPAAAASIEVQTPELDQAISDLEARVQQLEQAEPDVDLSDIKSAIDALEQADTTQDEQINAIKSTLDTIQATLEQMQSGGSDSSDGSDNTDGSDGSDGSDSGNTVEPVEPAQGYDALAAVVNGTGQGYSTPQERGTWRKMGAPLSDTCLPYAEQADFATKRRNCAHGMHAWNTAAFDRKGNIYIRGGGHWSYEGNEFYRLSLQTGEWKRVSNSGKAVPTDPDGPERQDYKPLYDDGTPASAHHYAHLTYAGGKVISGPHNGFGGPSGHVPYIWEFDPETGTYDLTVEIDNAPNTFHFYSICSEYDPANGDVLISSRGLRRYDPDKNELTYLGNWVNDNLQGSDCLYDPETKTFYDWKGGWLFTAKVGQDKLLSTQRYRPYMEGTKISVRSGMALGPDRKIWMWNGERSVYVWDQSDISAKDFTEVRNEDSPESPEGCGGLDCSRSYNSDNGNYGKWWYIESLGVFIGLDEASEPLWVYRPPETLPDNSQIKADLKDQGYTCADTVIGWECPDLQDQVDAGSVQKGVYIRGATVNQEVDFNGAWLKGAVKDGKGALIARPGAVIRNVKVTGASTGVNASCVSPIAEGGRVEVHNLTCRDSDMGIQGNADEILIADSDIGMTLNQGANLGHVLYVCGGVDPDSCTVTVRNSRIHGPSDGGHTLKTGASRTVLENVTLDETRGTGSRLIDAINGGELVIRDSRLVAHPNDGNGDVIGFDTERRVDHSTNSVSLDSTTTVDCAGGKLLSGSPDGFNNAAQTEGCQ